MCRAEKGPMNSAGGSSPWQRAVHLAIFDRHEMVYVDKIEGRQAIRVYTGIGWRGPLHATASGKAFLASSTDKFVSSVVQGPLPRLTDRTLISPAALYEDLENTRMRGFSVNKGEWHQEVGGVGAAVLSRHAEPEGALSITFPVASTDDTRIELLGQMVHSAARQLSKERGYVERAEAVHTLIQHSSKLPDK
jgi:DNA-binding IclR family transcriptional regulator